MADTATRAYRRESFIRIPFVVMQSGLLGKVEPLRVCDGGVTGE
jgi:hypothetical protein